MTTRTSTGRLGVLRRIGRGVAVLALAVGTAAIAAGPANAVTPLTGNASTPQAVGPASASAPTAAAVASTSAGSIVYIAGNNVWLMAPDGSGKKQVTHDGTAASPYFSPSEANSGMIVALRTTSSIYGTVYVLNRAGGLVDRFTPAQFTAAGTVSCPVPYVTFPNSLTRATVSPDGAHIAYTAAGYIQNGSCEVGLQLESFVINTDGAGAKVIDGGGPREVGTWINNTQVWLSDNNFGSIGMYRLTLPSSTSSLMLADDDLYGDTAFYDPSQGGSTVATGGWSFNAGSNVVRLWNSSNLSQRCEIDATAGQGDPNADGQAYAWPISMAPTGTGVTWWEVNGDSSVDTSDEGIYVAAVPSSGCPSTKILIASGGSYPFWGAAAVDAPVPPNTAPVVTVTAKPAALIRSTSASISYRVSDATDFSVATSCTLDGRAIACASPRSLTGLAQGKHTFVVTATDPEGAKGTAAVSWTVDTGLPTVSVTTPAAVTLGSGVVFHWAGTDHVSGVAGYDVAYTAASYTGAFTWGVKYAGTTLTSWTLTALKPGYEYCIKVRTHDKAGNVSAYGPARCTTHPMDDRSLHSSSFWTKPTVASAYTHTESDAAHTGATLTLANAHVSHLGVLATVTTTGGSVAVYVGATKIGSVSLKASAAHYQQVLWLPTVSLRTGTVTLKTLSAAAVRVDGLVDLRTP